MSEKRHERNVTEQAVILALAFRAGLASHNGPDFAVEPATLKNDQYNGFDLIIHRGRNRLFVDATSSYRYKGRKISRSVKYAKRTRFWIYVLKADWQTAVFDIGIDPCFRRSWGQLKDGEKAALQEACPKHGNSCRFARKLYEFSTLINRTLASSTTQARDFAMNVPEPPF